MAWAMGIAAGMQILGGFGGASASKAQARAENTVRKEQVKQSKYQTDARNAQSNLANHLTALNNKRISRAAEKAHSTAGENATRIMQQRSAQGFEASITQAEQLGEIAAASGAGAFTSSGIDAIERAARLGQDRTNTQFSKQTRQLENDLTQQVASSAANVMANMSMSMNQAETNMSTYIPTASAGANYLSMLGAVAQIAAPFLSSMGGGKVTNNPSNLTGGSLGLQRPTTGFFK